MSWIACLLTLSPNAKTLDDIPYDYKPEPLGSVAEVLSLISELFPDVDCSDPTWLRLDREDYIVEFMIGSEEPVTSIGFRPHGCDSFMDALQLLCEQTGCRAIDTSDGALIDFNDNPMQGFHCWREYAQQVLGSDSAYRTAQVYAVTQKQEALPQNPRILRSTLRRRLRRQ